MKYNLVKREDRWDLYDSKGHKFASSVQGSVNMLSLENCQAIECGYDLDKLAEEFAKNHSIYPTAQDDTEYGFKHGFQKALELMRDKKFTEEDVKSLIDNIHSIYEDGFGIATDYKKQRSYELIQSTQ